ncbi:LexA family protein [Paraburkholderia saeva]|uniref:Peptidase S24/S26A/S26B/S26C domain-containing protein n=1 Tax=Paraburkholderia saeva TaxID=2777537 RepID=A0A9N8RWQ8_9BURK|nr:S24 family peptidase [Paraburkholderia saeva]CAG4903303.1 hypothetical protein LMG31841_03216 [Paraburkholderia saeva]
MTKDDFLSTDLTKQWLRVVSDSMANPNNVRDSCHPGDLLSIDRNRKAADGDFVMVDVGDMVSLMELNIKDGKCIARYLNPAYPNVLTIDDSCVLGVVSMVGRRRSLDQKEVCHA